MKTRFARIALAAALLSSGCGDVVGTTGASLEGTYALRTMDSAPLPFLLWADSRARYYLVNDTLVFDGRETATRHYAVRIDSVARQYSEVRPYRMEYNYRVHRDSVVFTFYCPPNALCVAPPIGWLRPGYRLLVAYSRSSTGPGPLAAYERVK